MARQTFVHERAPSGSAPAAASPVVAAPRLRAQPPLAAVIQRARINPRSLTREDVAQLHQSIGNAAVGRLLTGAAAPNRTGLPDALKTNVEAISGLSMDDVRVHRGSAEPAKVRAYAYARGTEIHLGPGQEHHLPHETWHIVQQKQGRVRPTVQVGGLPINGEEHLEAEATSMGEQIADPTRRRVSEHSSSHGPQADRQNIQLIDGTYQLQPWKWLFGPAAVKNYQFGSFFYRSTTQSPRSLARAGGIAPLSPASSTPSWLQTTLYMWFPALNPGVMSVARTLSAALNYGFQYQMRQSEKNAGAIPKVYIYKIRADGKRGIDMEQTIPKLMQGTMSGEEEEMMLEQVDMKDVELVQTLAGVEESEDEDQE